MVFLLLFATLCSLSILVWTTYDWFRIDPGLSIFQRLLFTTMAIVVTPLFLVFEFPKLKSFEINDGRVVIRNLLTGKTKEVLIENVDGFKTTSKWAKGGHVYEILIIANGKIFQKISSNYIMNYDIIRLEVKKRLTPLKLDEFEDMRSFVKEKHQD